MSTKIHELYEDEKSKKFVNHLIKSYLPINKPQKVWEFEDKKEHSCNVCGHKLIDMGTVMGKMMSSKEFMKDSIDQMKIRVFGEEEIKYEDIAIIKHITHGAILAWQGEKTTTYLCQPCIQDLLEMVSTKLLTGDKNIVWITNQMRRDQIFNSFKENPVLDKQEKEKVEEIKYRADKRKATFGDLEVLQKLKEKMDEKQ